MNPIPRPETAALHAAALDLYTATLGRFVDAHDPDECGQDCRALRAELDAARAVLDLVERLALGWRRLPISRSRLR